MTFTSAKIGWMSFVHTNIGPLYAVVTKDEGAHLERVDLPLPSNLNQVDAFNVTPYRWGDHGVMLLITFESNLKQNVYSYVSTDDGMTWRSNLIQGGLDDLSIAMDTLNQAAYMTPDSKTLLRYDSHEDHWVTIDIPSLNGGKVIDIEVVTEQIVYLIVADDKDNHYLIRTLDGGKQWIGGTSP